MTNNGGPNFYKKKLKKEEIELTETEEKTIALIFSQN